MSMTTAPAAREAFIAGLRDLAGFLAAHPGVAVSEQETQITLTAYGADDDADTRQIEAFAAAAGLDVTDDRPSGGQIRASRAFGPVTYRAFTYSHARLAESDARNSYADNVQVDAPADVTEIARAA